MSYHYGQADWFYGKGKAEDAQTTPGSEAQASPAPPPSASPTMDTQTVPSPAPVETSPPPITEEGGGINMMLIAGVGFLALTGILIYLKYSKGSDEVLEEDEEQPNEPGIATES